MIKGKTGRSSGCTAIPTVTTFPLVFNNVIKGSRGRTAGTVSMIPSIVLMAAYNVIKTASFHHTRAYMNQLKIMKARGAFDSSNNYLHLILVSAKKECISAEMFHSCLLLIRGGTNDCNLEPQSLGKFNGDVT